MTTTNSTPPRRTLRPLRWSLQFACNNRHGNPTGRVESIHLGAGRGNYVYGTDYLDDHYLHLNDVCGKPLVFRWYRGGWFQLGGKTFECVGKRHYVGNIIWDSCFVSRQTIRDVCLFLKRRGWEPEEGTTKLWDWWRGLK